MMLMKYVLLVIVAAIGVPIKNANAMCQTKGKVIPHVEANKHSPKLPSIGGEVSVIATKRGWVFVDVGHYPEPDSRGGWIREGEFECLE
jgi:hypothetical protein